MNLLKIISKTYCADILLTIDKLKEVNFGLISKKVGHPSIATRRLNELNKYGLVNRKVAQDARRTVNYSLTEEGKKVVKTIKQILDIEKRLKKDF